jgi:hypothetical protein
VVVAQWLGVVEPVLWPVGRHFKIDGSEKLDDLGINGIATVLL